MIQGASRKPQEAQVASLIISEAQVFMLVPCHTGLESRISQPARRKASLPSNKNRSRVEGRFTKIKDMPPALEKLVFQAIWDGLRLIL